jgi:hypothetical protein
METRFVWNSCSYTLKLVLMDYQNVHVVVGRWFDEENFVFFEKVM